jgi:hypothetical protein
VDGFAGALFKSPELDNYELASSLPATGTADPVPDKVRTIAGLKLDVGRLPGAYSVRPPR